MSDNSPASPRKTDQRVLRTRDRLGDAIMELLVEKPFDQITVQEILERAEVSRSTFYQHYRDKNDLFLSDVDDFFEKMASLLTRSGDRSERVAPVAELFAHIGESQEFYTALLASGRIQDVVELGEAHFARGIEARLQRRPDARPLSPVTREALAYAFAGALFGLVRQWVQRGRTETPCAMDQLFHGLVSGSIKASCQ